MKTLIHAIASLCLYEKATTKKILILLLLSFCRVNNAVVAQSVTYSYTGAVQTYTVPCGVTSIAVDVAGAAGGMAPGFAYGNAGGRVQATIAVTPGQVLYVYVGQQPPAASTCGSGTAGGSNGGGGADGGAGSPFGCSGAGGGGASDIRTISGNSIAALNSRLVVAGGGGGDADDCGISVGGVGGGLIGGNGTSSCGAFATYAGQGGTSSAGGAGAALGGSPGGLGFGGSGEIFESGGGGGGGYYGGGGGVNGSGGGGSSYYGGIGVSGATTTPGIIPGDGFVMITAPSPISGPDSVCIGATASLSSSPSGGIWSSSNTSIVTVGSTGIMQGVAGGTATISYSLGAGCNYTLAITVNPITPSPITGNTACLCTGVSGLLYSSPAGGTWSSSNPAVATVAGGYYLPDTATGYVVAIAPGTTTISYTMYSACGVIASSVVVSVYPIPSPGTVSGSSTVLTGATTTLTATVAGGYWASDDTSVARVDSFGVVTGIAPGYAYIVHYVVGACPSCVSTASWPITVNSCTPPAAIAGMTTVCEGSQITLTDSTGGGTWQSSNANASIGSSTGIVTGVHPGTSMISYTLISTGCSAYQIITVSPSGGTIFGSPVVAVASSTTLSETVFGGTWSSSDSSVATVTSAGVVTGVSFGAAIISYAVTGGVCGSGYATMLITVGAAYCTPVFGDPGYTCTNWGDLCRIVNLTGISGTITDLVACNSTGYLDRTTLSCSLQQGATYGVLVQSSSILYSDVQIWIDFNKDGTFQASESVGGSSSIHGLAAISITIPPGVPTGSLMRMRIVADIATCCGGAFYPSIPPCPTSAISYGEARDYIVNIVPCNAAPIIGSSNVCVGMSTTLSDSTSGGTWSSSDISIATVNSTGIVSGVAAGTATISYMLGSGCSATSVVTVNAAPAAIVGPSAVCVGATITLSDSTAGGAWSSSNPSIASVDLTGMVTGNSGGTATISYSVTSSCGTGFVMFMITVNPTPNVDPHGDSTYVAGVLAGALNFTGSVAGASFSWTSTADVGFGTSGIGNIPSYTAVNAGPTPIVATVVVTPSANGCTGAPDTFLITVDPNPSGCVVYGTYTQGIWSSRIITLCDGTNDCSDRKTPVLLIDYLLQGGQITVGRPGRSVIIPAYAALPVNEVLPGSWGANELTYAGDVTISNVAGSIFAVNYLSGGLLNNSLLGEQMAMKLNLRMTPGLVNFPIVYTPGDDSHFQTFEANETCCMFTCGDTRPICFAISKSVAHYLTHGGTQRADLNNLVDLADDLLGGILIPGQNVGGSIVPSYADVAAALSTISSAFNYFRTFDGTYGCTAAKAVAGTSMGTIESQTRIYPNPTKGRFSIEVPALEQDAHVTVLDINGRSLISVTMSASPYEQKLQLDMPDVARGMYFIRIEAGDKVFAKKLMLE